MTLCVVPEPAVEAVEPYPDVVPYSTTDVAASSVVHVTVAEVSDVEAVTPLIDG